MRASSRSPDTGSIPIAHDDRRAFPRVSSTCIVEYRPIGDQEAIAAVKTQSQGLLQNISGGGLCVRLAERPAKGQLLALNIQLPMFPTSVIALGRVSWVAPVGDQESDVGIEFWWVGWQDAGAQEQIRAFIESSLHSVNQPTAKGQPKS